MDRQTASETVIGHGDLCPNEGCTNERAVSRTGQVYRMCRPCLNAYEREGNQRRQAELRDVRKSNVPVAQAPLLPFGARAHGARGTASVPFEEPSVLSPMVQLLWDAGLKEKFAAVVRELANGTPD